MTANDLMGRYADVQIAVDGLLQMSRQLSDRSIPSSYENLKLIEDGLFVIGHELLALTLDLKAEARALEINNSKAVLFMEQCQLLLAKHERLAEENGLLPAIIANRLQREPAAQSFPTDRFDVSIDEDAGVVVVRERQSFGLPANVVAFPARGQHHAAGPAHDGDAGGAA